MPRRPRHGIGGTVFHVLNRAVVRARIFANEGDYDAFEIVLEQVKKAIPIRLLAYCVMPNHWHLVLWPTTDGQLSEFVHRLTVTHVQRWHAFHETSGTGALYQGRFKSVPVEADTHLWTLLRYVERNPVRAGLVVRAEEWRWSSLARRHRADPFRRELLDPWPIDEPSDWLDRVNRPETAAELDAVRNAITRGAPFGSPAWSEQVAARLDLSKKLRARGRPRQLLREKNPGLA